MNKKSTFTLAIGDRVFHKEKDLRHFFSENIIAHEMLYVPISAQHYPFMEEFVRGIPGITRDVLIEGCFVAYKKGAYNSYHNFDSLNFIRGNGEVISVSFNDVGIKLNALCKKFRESRAANFQTLH